jgi:hypothetical protein
LCYSEVPGVFGVYISAPAPPFFFLCSPSAAQQRRRWLPCRAARGPPASPGLHASPPSSPTASTPSCWPSPSAARRSAAARAASSCLPSQAAAAHRRCSSAGATSCLCQLPRVALRPPAALAPLLWPSPTCATPPASARALPGPNLAAVMASAVRASLTLLFWSKTLSSFPSLCFALSCSRISPRAPDPPSLPVFYSGEPPIHRGQTTPAPPDPREPLP